jgi:hypothetical protein
MINVKTIVADHLVEPMSAASTKTNKVKEI